MTSRPRICFATFELQGFTPGGIGVAIHNLITTYADTADITVLWYGAVPIQDVAFRSLYPACTFHAADHWAKRDRDDDRIWPERRNALNGRHWQAILVLRALRALEREFGPFDVVEFPDFAGAALPALQEKRLGQALTETTIAVRLHSTEAVLRLFDHRPASRDNAITADLERKALAEADLVIAHLDPIADHVAAHFGFPAAWRDRVVVELLPVQVGTAAAAPRTSLGDETPLLFTSKFQWFKRPHVFVNAAAAFMDSEPSYRGEAFLLAHSVDQDLLDHCRRLVPRRHATRFHVVHDMPADAREALIREGITVFPTAYESFCLAAHEASRLGSVVVVNGANPAFGDRTPWIAGRNCEKFDGSVSGLRLALQKLWSARERIALEPLKDEPAAPYWTRPARKVRISGPPDSGTDLSAVIATTRSDHSWVDTAMSILLADARRVQIVVAHNGGIDPSMARDIAGLPGSAAGATLSFIDLGWRADTAALLNAGVKLAAYERVVVARAGTVFDPHFLGAAARALGAGGHSFVVAQAGVDAPTETGHAPRFLGRTMIGEGMNAAAFANICGGIECVGRRSAFIDLQYDEDLDRYVDLDFYLRAMAGGDGVLCGNTVGVVAGDVANDLSPPFRSHLDAVLVKHGAAAAALGVRLVAAFDAQERPGQKPSNQRKPAAGQRPAPKPVEIAGQPLTYYQRQTFSWWRMMLRHPTKPLRWLLVKELAEGPGSPPRGPERGRHAEEGAPARQRRGKGGGQGLPGGARRR